MKASELIRNLTVLMKTHGDLPVGSHQTEMGNYFAVEGVEVKTATRRNSISDDDEELGDTFIGLEVL